MYTNWVAAMGLSCSYKLIHSISEEYPISVNDLSYNIQHTVVFDPQKGTTPIAKLSQCVFYYFVFRRNTVLITGLFK